MHSAKKSLYQKLIVLFVLVGLVFYFGGYQSGLPALVAVFLVWKWSVGSTLLLMHEAVKASADPEIREKLDRALSK